MVPAVLRHKCLLAVLLAAPLLLPAVLAQESPPASSKAISGALQPLVDSHSLAGAVTLVADKERVLSEGAVGYGDIAAGKPMTTSALFWIASQSKPGGKYQYSNAGINTAGRIIEVKSGMPYEEFLETRLLLPLGMKDTTFWPGDAQLSRLAKSYKPNRDGNGLEETTITQLKYPLSDRKRQPMPAGGLFSTTHDLARFCQMILSGGVFEGKRYLSQAAVAELTRKQTPKQIKDGYGLGWATGGGSFGHGGAYSTNMTIDRDRGLIYVFLVQHAGFPGNGGSSFDVFKRTAELEFGKKVKP